MHIQIVRTFVYQPNNIQRFVLFVVTTPQSAARPCLHLQNQPALPRGLWALLSLIGLAPAPWASKRIRPRRLRRPNEGR